MTTIFNERTRIIGAETEDGRLLVKEDPKEAMSEREILESILVELKIINVHLSGYSNENISEEDIR